VATTATTPDVGAPPETPDVGAPPGIDAAAPAENATLPDEADATVTVAREDDIATKATEPATEATEPATEATEPATETTEPATEATEPRAATGSEDSEG
jgi:hypothetical protein